MCVRCAHVPFLAPGFHSNWKRTNSPSKVQVLGQRLPANVRWIQVLYCERRSAKIYALKRIVNLFYLLATAATGQVAFRGYARLVRVRHLLQILPLSLASVRRHLADRTPVRRKILKPTLACHQSVTSHQSASPVTGLSLACHQSSLFRLCNMAALAKIYLVFYNVTLTLG